MREASSRGLRAIKVEASLTRRVYETLRRSIISGQLPPGSLHSVRVLADSLGVSRTPVREALIDLAADGMVRFERNRGVRILQTSLHDLEEIFTLRLLLEVPATFRAARQFDAAMLRSLRKEFEGMERAAERGEEQDLMAHDRRFHAVILEASGNRRLASYVDRLRDLVLIRGVSTVGRSRTLRDIVAEHRAVLEGIEAADPKRAAAAMAAHVSHTGRLILDQEAGGRVSDETLWADVVETWTRPVPPARSRRSTRHRAARGSP